MDRKKVESSILKSVGYDEKRKILETELLNDSLYEYYKVPAKEYKDLLNAESLGGYYNQVIKKHKYKKLK